MEEDFAAKVVAVDPIAPPRLFGGIERHGRRLAVLGPDGSSWTHEALAAEADRWAEMHLGTGSERGLLAIEMANQLEFHFQASVFTQNVDFAMKCTRELNATAVMVNDHTAFRVDWMPFGGRDSSGLGLGGIPYSMHEMTREKLIVFQSEEL